MYLALHVPGTVASVPDTLHVLINKVPIPEAASGPLLLLLVEVIHSLTRAVESAAPEALLSGGSAPDRKRSIRHLAQSTVGAWSIVHHSG